MYKALFKPGPSLTKLQPMTGKLKILMYHGFQSERNQEAVMSIRMDCRNPGVDEIRFI